MSGKGNKAEKAAGPVPRDEASGTEGPPVEFRDSLGTEHPVREGLRICEAHGKIAEGFIKARREARRLEWESRLLGGVTADWQVELGRLAAERAERARRLETAKARGLIDLAGNLEVAIAGTDRRAGELRALLEAAGPAVSENQKVRDGRLAGCQRRLEAIDQEVARSQAPRPRATPEIEEAILRAEQAIAERQATEQEAAAEADAAFAAGRSRLDALNLEVGKAQARTRHALGHAVAECCAAAGVRARGLLLPKLGFYASFPKRVPDEAVQVYEQAMTAAEVAAKLGDDTAARAFWGAVGEQAGAVLELRVGGVPMVRRGPTKQWPDHDREAGIGVT